MTRRFLPLVFAGAVLAIAAMPAAAHEPDPVFAGPRWAQDQLLSYTWKTGQVPPTWATGPIDAGAWDANRSRASRAATFVRGTNPTSLIAYGEPTGCSTIGIACFSRMGAPTSFRMWFRAQGYAFDWGKLRWCQALTTIASGCYDLENIALDEFGHVEILDHHANYEGESDYLDAVVQRKSRAYPQAGWDAHAFGRCDVASLQLEYEPFSAAAAYSTCLALATTVTVSASATTIPVGGSVRFSATLRVANLTAYRALANDPVSGRAMLLQRRTPGTTAWTTIATMTPSFTLPGTYATTVLPTATYEWRAMFGTPPNEGLIGAASTVVKVSVGA
ncbi:MAG TPA: hypothetical protein VLS28_02840 [Candidatus Sulfomarinibacteraceae bacterium]|nr:hypothetical protein [Candidatus Sulfomarinibacteraceae bacterium]